jgi:hypothetical protein
MSTSVLDDPDLAELAALAADDEPEPEQPDTPPKRRRIRSQAYRDHQREYRRAKRGAAGPKVTPNRAPRPGTSNAAIVRRAIDELGLLYALLGAGVRLVDAPAGSEIVARSTDLAGSWQTVLETNKQLREWFAASERYSAWLPVIATHAQLAGAIVLAHAAARSGTMPPAPEQPQPAEAWQPPAWPDLGAGTGD